MPQPFDRPTLWNPACIPLLPAHHPLLTLGEPARAPDTYALYFNDETVLTTAPPATDGLIDTLYLHFRVSDLQLLVLPPDDLTRRHALFPSARTGIDQPGSRYARLLDSPTAHYVLPYNPTREHRRKMANALVDRATDNGRSKHRHPERIIRAIHGSTAKRIDLGPLVQYRPYLRDRALILPERMVLTLELLPIGSFIVLKHEPMADPDTHFYQLAYHACGYTIALPITSFGTGAYGNIIIPVRYHADYDGWAVEIGAMLGLPHNSGARVAVPPGMAARQGGLLLARLANEVRPMHGMAEVMWYLTSVAAGLVRMPGVQETRRVGPAVTEVMEAARRRVGDVVMFNPPAVRSVGDRPRTVSMEQWDVHARVMQLAALMALMDQNVAYYVCLWHSKSQEERAVMMRRPLFDALGDAVQAQAWLWDRYRHAFAWLMTMHFPDRRPVPVARPSRHWLVQQRGRRGEEILRAQEHRLMKMMERRDESV